MRETEALFPACGAVVINIQEKTSKINPNSYTHRLVTFTRHKKQASVCVCACGCVYACVVCVFVSIWRACVCVCVCVSVMMSVYGCTPLKTLIYNYIIVY